VKKARKQESRIDVPLEEFVAKGQAAQADIDTYLIDAEIEKANQRVLDEIETADAKQLLQQLGMNQDTWPAALAIAKRWLKKHWSDGWRAAGGRAARHRKLPAHEGPAAKIHQWHRW
jgi:hypothetical protein